MTRKKIQKEIDLIKNQLISKYHPKKIILFGSAAWGKINEDSDLDFLIIKDDVPYYDRDRVRELYRIVVSDMPTDMLVYKPKEFDERYRMGDPFIRLIAAKGKVIYG